MQYSIYGHTDRLAWQPWQSALIAEDVAISGDVYGVESGELREPRDRITAEISERQA